jgi:hypothetical protein
MELRKMKVTKACESPSRSRKRTRTKKRRSASRSPKKKSKHICMALSFSSSSLHSLVLCKFILSLSLLVLDAEDDMECDDVEAVYSVSSLEKEVESKVSKNVELRGIETLLQK